MQITGAKLTKWQEKLLTQAIQISADFIQQKYHLEIDIKELITIRCSNTCRFAYYTQGKGLIRLNLKATSIRLYDKKTLGNYPTQVKGGFLHSYVCQLIHEMTHLVQDIEDRCYSEVETTRNELEYLRSINLIK